MNTRLDSVAPELADRLRAADADALRRVAVAAADLAVAQTPLSDPRVQQADGAEVQRLVDELDEAAWEVQSRVRAGRVPEEEYLQAFSKARAASAAAFALDPDPLTAAVESVYEAQAAVRDVAPIRAAVLDILGR